MLQFKSVNNFKFLLFLQDSLALFFLLFLDLNIPCFQLKNFLLHVFQLILFFLEFNNLFVEIFLSCSELFTAEIEQILTSIRDVGNPPLPHRLCILRHYLSAFIKVANSVPVTS